LILGGWRAHRASGWVEGQGFLALSEVEGSPAKIDSRAAPSFLALSAVAKGALVHPFTLSP